MRVRSREVGRRPDRSKLASAAKKTLATYELLEQRRLFAAFTAGDLVVERLGDGSAALGNGGTAVFLDEFHTTGTGQSANNTISVPSSGGSPLTDSGTATSDGLLNLSTNGQYLVLPGYSAAAGTASVASAAIPRVIGRVDSAGNVDTSTTFSDGYTGNNFRGVTSVDGSGFWTTGTASTNGGVHYIPFGATSSTQVSSTTLASNTRAITIFNGQLYADGATTSGPLEGPGSVGTGLPTTTGQTITELNGFPTTTASNYQFVFKDANTIYVADDRTTAGGAGGIEKWVQSGGTWSMAYSALNGTGTGAAFRGLAIGSNGTLYGTSTETNANSLVAITDTGSGFNFTVLATAPTNEVFRGVAFAPATIGGAPTVTNVSPAGGTTAGGTSVSISGAGFSGATTVSFGGTLAGFTINSDNSITATSPAHSTGQVDIQVTTGNGTSSIVPADHYTFTSAPIVSSLGTTSGPAAGGTSVTINGSGFTGATAVNFGGTPASGFTVNGDNSITATAPAHLAGTVDVTVTTSGGTSAPVAADQFTYTGGPSISNLASTPPAASGLAFDGGGTVIIINGSNFINGATNVTFGGTASPTVTFVSSSQIKAVAPAHSDGRFDVVVSTSGGSATLSNSITYADSVAAMETLPSGATNVTLNSSSDPLIVTQILSQPGTVNGVTYSSWAVLAQDSTGSFELFGSLPGYTPTVGDTVSATGTWSPFHQIPELGSITTITKTGTRTAPGPITTTIDQINTSPLSLSKAGYLLTLNNVTISGATVGTFGTQNITATLGDGVNTMTFFYWPTSYSSANSYFDGLTIPTGPVTLTGFASVFTSGSTNTVEFSPISAQGASDKISLSTDAVATGEADGFSKVTRGTSIHVTISRTESVDAVDVGFGLLNDSAVAGTDFSTTQMSPIHLNPGQTAATFTITTSSASSSGDKLFSVQLTSASSNDPTIISGIVGGPQTIVITDPNSKHTISNSSFLENATIQVNGPRHTANQTGTSDAGISLFQVEADNAANDPTLQTPPGTGTQFESYGVLTYNDWNGSSGDPSHLFSLGGNAIDHITGIELESVAVPQSFDHDGQLDVYLSFDATTDITWNATTPVTYDKTSTPQGIGSAFGAKHLLGTINYSANQSAGGYTPFNLTSLDPSGLTLLKSALNTSTSNNAHPFRIIVAAHDANASMSWQGSNSAITDLSPILRINYGTTPATLPAWLAPGSVATWNAPNLNVTGSATIIADPGADEPNITVGNGGHLNILPTNSDEFIHIGGLTLTGGGSADMKSVSGRSHTHHDVLVLGTLAGAAPTFSVDSISKLDLEDNDLIVHKGSYSAVQALAVRGRNAGTGGLLDGTWTGTGLTSSSAANADANLYGFEGITLEVARNSDLPLGQLSNWQVGSQNETLGGSDILVKYTYTGDFAFEGAVNDDAATIFQALYDGGATTNNTAATGDTNGDGKIDDTDATAFQALFGNGTGGLNGNVL